jgi:hypothetical protein
MSKSKVAPKRQTEPAAANSWTFLFGHAYWLLPLVLFLTLRLFSADSYYLLAGDQCTFLELGRTFPKHQLYNHELYLIHPPLFGYAIGLLHLFLPLLVSGLLATLVFACLNFFVIRNLGLREDLPKTAIFVGLIYLAISRPAVHYDSHVARVSILVFSTSLAILSFLRFLREPGKQTLVAALAANVFSMMVSDQSLLLLPCQLIIYWVRGSRREWKSPALLAAGSLLAAMIWPAVRLAKFLSHGDLPAGIDGTIEFTRNLPLLTVIQPNFLPFTNAHRSLITQTSLSIFNLDPALLASFPVDLLSLPSLVGIGIIVLLIAAALARPVRRMRAIQWLALSLLFLVPVGLGMNEWYGMGFIVPFSLLIMEGAAASLAWLGSYVGKAEKISAIVLSALCVLGVVLWLNAPPRDVPSYRPHGGSHFLFTRPTVTRAAIVSNFFASAPPETGIMAPVLLSPEIVYLTGKRVIALPFDPALLDRFIEEYHITYLLTSSQFLTQYRKPLEDRYYGALVSRFLTEHPERYRLVQSVRENYGAVYSPTTYYVFQVVNGAGGHQP